MANLDYRTLPFWDSNLDVEARVADLLKQLTLQEKFSLCAGKSLFAMKPVPRLGIPILHMSDGPHGVGALGSHLKKMTYFPVGICRTATWNPALAEQYGRASAEEIRSIGYQMILGPAINIQRAPLCGRTFEYQTEDPYLNSRMAVAAVNGTQSVRVAACVKHYAANNQEFKRMRVSSEVSERALREIYLPAFEAAVREGNTWSVMACYNRVNGIYGCEHRDLLVTKLREEWGFRGVVISDWYAARPTSSTEACVKGGLGLEMPGGGSRYNQKRLATAFKASKFSEAELDSNLTGLLRVMILTGLLDDPKSLPAGARNTKEHFEISRKIAEEGIVLLKNEGPLLPLDINSVKKIAVLGPNVARKNGFGGGSSMIRAAHEITPLQGLKEKCKRKVKLVKNPADADVAVVVVGLHHCMLSHWDMEMYDKKSLAIPPAQVDLIQQTVTLNPKTVVVLVSGSPVEMDAWLEQVPAVVEMWYAGMEGGRALADILFGGVNPSGKLPITFPKRLADSPAHASERTFGGADKVFYDEGVFVGYRHFDARGIEPLFPFGHGLSYTTFAYDQLQINPAPVSGEGTVTVSLEVTNTGNRAGAEVVQLYIQDVEASVERPPKELKGFQKLFLAPGETQSATFELNLRDLSFWDEAANAWKAESGTFAVYIGSSSRDIRLQGEFDYTS